MMSTKESLKVSDRGNATVCYLIYAFYLSGAENLVYSLAARLASRYQVIVGSLYEAEDKEESARIVKHLEQFGVRTFEVGKHRGKGRIQTVWKLVRIFRAERVDVLHTHTLLPNFYGHLAGWLARVPVRIATLHSGGNDWTNRRSYWMEHLISRLTTQYVAVSAIPARDYNAVFGEAKQAVVIPNGVDINRFQNVRIDRDHKRRSLGLLPSDIVLINVGRVCEAKGQDQLIEAMSMVAKQYPNTHLLIVGDSKSQPELVERLLQLVQQLQLGHQVHILGSRADIPELLAVSDVFVFPSLHEAQPVALLEAMAAGLPVVASKISAIQDIVEDDREALLIPPGDSEAIAVAVEKLIADPIHARDLALRAQVKVQKQYSIESTVAAYDNLYRSLLRGVNKGRGR